MIDNYASILIKINCMFEIIIVFRRNNFHEFYNLN